MYRKEFKRLYAEYKSNRMDQSEIEVGNQLRIDWDTFDQFRISSEPTKIITKEEARRDITYFFLLLKYAYSGFEYYSQFADFVKIEDQAIRNLKNDADGYISVVNLCKIIHRELSPHINDGHVWAEYADYEALFLRSCIPYVTDIVVSKVSEELVVIQGAGNLRPGTVIKRTDIHGELFRTLIAGCIDECYLIGCYTECDPGSIVIAGQHYKTHVLKSCNSRRLTEDPYSLKEDAKYAVFRNSTYQIYENSLMHEQNFSDAGKRCASKDFVIWDLSNNHGGNSIFPEFYLRFLNGYVYTEMDTVVLQSPVVGNSEGDKFYRWQKSSVFDNSKASYSGDLFVVMNKETGSSAELAVFFAKSCKKVTTIGSPSAGVGIFGEVRSYRLPNSGILVGLPYKVFYEDDFEIGKGYMPDYWIDDEDPVEYLLKYILQVERYEK